MKVKITIYAYLLACMECFPSDITRQLLSLPSFSFMFIIITLPSAIQVSCVVSNHCPDIDKKDMISISVGGGGISTTTK